MKTAPTLIDCFCGAGGLSLGFRRAGFDSIFAFDNDPVCVETYRSNLNKHCVVADATKLTRSSIEDILGRSVSPDVIAGGPPCQGFSVQRRGGHHDERNNLVLDFLRLVGEFRPKFFVIENVGGLLSPRGQAVMDRLHIWCRAAGYFPHIQKLLAMDYGVPQDRRRVFIVGELITGAQCHFTFPPPGLVSGARTVREAISDLMEKPQDVVANHKSDKLSAINLQRIRSISEGQGRDALPNHLQLACHKNNAHHRHLDVYGRMWWDRPAPTITARFDSFSRGRFGHPSLDRTITLREGARLQTFEDGFVFHGTKVQVAKQIGNAVPPNLACAVAQQIRKLISTQ